MEIILLTVCVIPVAVVAVVASVDHALASYKAAKWARMYGKEE